MYRLTHISPWCAREGALVFSTASWVLWNWNCSLTEEHLLSLPSSGVSDTGGIRDKLGDIISPSLAATLNASPQWVWVCSAYTLDPVSCSLNAFSPERITELWWSRFNCFGERRWEQIKSLPPLFATKSPTKNTHFIKEKAKHNSILWIFFLFFVLNFKFIPLLLWVTIPVFIFHLMLEELFNPWLW